MNRLYTPCRRQNTHLCLPMSPANVSGERSLKYAAQPLGCLPFATRTPRPRRGLLLQPGSRKEKTRGMDLQMVYNPEQTYSLHQPDSHAPRWLPVGSIKPRPWLTPGPARSSSLGKLPWSRWFPCHKDPSEFLLPQDQQSLPWHWVPKGDPTNPGPNPHPICCPEAPRWFQWTPASSPLRLWVAPMMPGRSHDASLLMDFSKQAPRLALSQPTPTAPGSWQVPEKPEWKRVKKFCFSYGILLKETTYTWLESQKKNPGRKSRKPI